MLATIICQCSQLAQKVIRHTYQKCVAQLKPSDYKKRSVKLRFIRHYLIAVASQARTSPHANAMA
jgi:hypothetical protein